MSKSTVKGISCLVLSFFLLLLACGRNQAVPIRRYAFALANDRHDEAEYRQLLGNWAIDGLVIGDTWDRVEPEEGVYDWSRIDLAAGVAKQFHKKITLDIFGSVFARPPEWVKTSGAEFVDVADPRAPGRIVSEAVSWDDVLLAKWSDFVRALSRHIAERGYSGNLFAVGITMPMPEMTLIYCRDGMFGNRPYDRTRYMAAWKRMVDVYEEEFPNTRKLICAPHDGFICFGLKDTSFYTELMDYALLKGGSTFGVFATDLSAKGSRRTADYLVYGKQTFIGYQTIWSSTNDPGDRLQGSLEAAIDFGERAGADYFEIYAVDVKSGTPSIQAAIASIHRQ